MRKICRLLPVTAFLLQISACTGQSAGEIHLTGAQPALPVMEHIALNTNRCWFKSRDKNFAAYRLAPELQSSLGRPRILAVPYDDPGGRPLLVIEAAGSPAHVTAYGPLMHARTGKRISADLKRWIKGDKNC